ncbi:MAG: VOC family protein [Saprospiraceae bacterium]
MKQLNVYLTFPGNCEEALNFYKTCMGGEIASINRLGDSPMEVAEADKNRIMHAEFKADGIYFMASDSMPGQPIRSGDMVTLSINFTDAAQQDQIYNALAEGGNVTMALQETFWGAMFGMLTDKYGIHWMFNRELSE